MHHHDIRSPAAKDVSSMFADPGFETVAPFHYFLSRIMLCNFSPDVLAIFTVLSKYLLIACGILHVGNMRKLEEGAVSDLASMLFAFFPRFSKKPLGYLFYKRIKRIVSLILKKFKAADSQCSEEEAKYNTRFCFIVVGGGVMDIIIFICSPLASL